MGCYVNLPNNGNKKNWLEAAGEKFAPDVNSWKERPNGTLPVVLLDNGIFTAAGVAFSDAEWLVFSDPSDDRPRWYYYVDVDKLRNYSPIDDYYKEENAGT
jgi:hypothetical protein